MPHDPAKLWQDMHHAGRAIQRFVAGRTLDDYREDLMLRSAVERQFEIIGEAMRRMGAADPTLTKQLDSYRRIIAFRNIIAHGYDILDASIVWQIINENLPLLVEQAEKHLRKLP